VELQSGDVRAPEFEVEQIVGRREHQGGTQYRVRWKTYEASEDTWESAEELLRSAAEMVDAFELRRRAAAQSEAETAACADVGASSGKRRRDGHIISLNETAPTDGMDWQPRQTRPRADQHHDDKVESTYPQAQVGDVVEVDRRFATDGGSAELVEIDSDRGLYKVKYCVGGCSEKVKRCAFTITRRNEAADVMQQHHKDMGASEESSMQRSTTSVTSDCGSSLRCSVCLSAMEWLPQDTSITTLECGHTFCSGCIEGWFQQGRKCCPNCGKGYSSLRRATTTTAQGRTQS
jgi:hypothetical protein